MKFINTKSITTGIIALLIGVFAVFGISKALNYSRDATVQGTVAAFILNPEGRIDGAVLDTGDQIHFGAETGALLAEQIKIGDSMSATGHAGTRTDYGREMRAETLQIGDKTITVLHSKPPRGEGGDKPKRPRDGKDKPKKPRPEDDQKPSQDVNAPKPDEADAPKPELNAPPAAPTQTASANGQVRFVLVGGKGEARGLILSGGEQIALPKEVNDANLTFNQETTIRVEGNSAKSEFGTVIHPTRLTIGSQTFSFNR